MMPWPSKTTSRGCALAERLVGDLSELAEDDLRERAEGFLGLTRGL